MLIHTYLSTPFFEILYEINLTESKNLVLTWINNQYITWQLSNWKKIGLNRSQRLGMGIFPCLTSSNNSHCFTIIYYTIDKNNKLLYNCSGKSSLNFFPRITFNIFTPPPLTLLKSDNVDYSLKLRIFFFPINYSFPKDLINSPLGYTINKFIQYFYLILNINSNYQPLKMFQPTVSNHKTPITHH